MDAATEAEMRVGAPADVERVGPVEHLGVPRRRTEQGRHLLALGDPVPRDLDVGGGRALEEVQRCVVADQLLGGRRHDGGVLCPCDESFPLVPVGQQGVHAVAQHVDRGLVPRHQEEHGRGDDLVPGQLTAREVAEQVVARPSPPLVREGAQVLGELLRRLLGRAACAVGKAVLVHLHDRVAPGHERGPVVSGHTEQLGDHGDRQRLGQVVEQVGLAVGGDALGERADHRPGQPLDGGTQPFHVAAGEGGGDQPAQPGVRGRLVLQQRVAVQHVERGEPLGRGRVGPEPPE